MSFSNDALRMEDIPSLDEGNFLPLHRNLLTVRLAGSVIAFVVIAIVVAVVTAIAGLSAWLIALLTAAPLLLLAIIATTTVLSFKYWGYAVREHDVSVRHGVLLRSATSVPFNRVQHVAVNTGPLDRMLGLATVRVFTAGGSGADLVIQGLPTDTAATLKDTISATVAAQSETEAAPPGPTIAPPPAPGGPGPTGEPTSPPGTD